MSDHEPPIPNQVYMKVTNWTDSGEKFSTSYGRDVVSNIEDANVITSLVQGQYYDGYEESTDEVLASTIHKVVLDIDLPCKLIPSTTPNHYHLYIEQTMFWRDYKRLLTALRYAGIIEEGYYQAVMQRGYTAVRLPWIKKEEPTTPPLLEDEYPF